MDGGQQENEGDHVQIPDNATVKEQFPDALQKMEVAEKQMSGMVYLNDACHNFEPTVQQEFLTLKKGQYQRLIFMKVELREREEEELEKFRDFCKENGHTIPEGYDDESRFVLRVLQGKKWKHDLTIQELISHCEWKKATYPLSYDPIKDMLATGVIYGHKRDISHRPVIVIDCAKILKMAAEIDRLVAATNYFLDGVISQAMIPGKIESWTAIFDLNKIGTGQMTNKNIQQVVKAMQKNYPGRLYKFHGINAGIMFRGLWAVVHNLVDDFTKEKMNIHGSDFAKELLQLIPAENLEQRFGGKSPTVVNYWPPIFV